MRKPLLDCPTPTQTSSERCTWEIPGDARRCEALLGWHFGATGRLLARALLFFASPFFRTLTPLPGSCHLDHRRRRYPARLHLLPTPPTSFTRSVKRPPSDHPPSSPPAFSPSHRQHPRTPSCVPFGLTPPRSDLLPRDARSVWALGPPFEWASDSRPAQPRLGQVQLRREEAH